MHVKKTLKKRDKAIEDFCLSAVYISCAVTKRIYWVDLSALAPAIFSISVQAATQTTGQMVQFDIKAQRADKALIEYAKQTEQTVVFSYELAKQYDANSVYGFYTQI